MHCGGFSCWGARALGVQASVFAARGMWDLPGPEIEPISPALAGGFLTTAPPGKSLVMFFINLRKLTSFPTFLRVFYHEWVLNFVPCFSATIYMIMWCRKSTVKDVENKRMDTKRGEPQWGGDGGVLIWEIGIDMYTMMCIKLMTDLKKKKNKKKKALLIWWITLIGFQILSKLCIPGSNPICIVGFFNSFTYCWILFADILLEIFLSTFMGYYFIVCLFVCFLYCVCLSLVSGQYWLHKLIWEGFPLYFLEEIGVNSSLSVW